MTKEQALLNLKFADYVENNVEDRDFDMCNWCNCLAAHAARFEPFEEDNEQEVSRSMGLTMEESSRIFIWTDSNIKLQDITKTMACNKLRELVFRHFPELSI